MEEKDEILTVVREGFARMDQQFARVDQRFERMDQRFERMDQRFERMDQRFERVDDQFSNLRRDFSDQLDGLSNGLHLELTAQSRKLLESVESVRAAIELVDGKLGLVGENVANVMHEIARYHANVESPLETRVTKLEGRVWILEEKK